MRLDRRTPASKKLARGSTPKSTKLENDEDEMASAALDKRGSPSSEESSTPMGMRIVVSLPEMPSPGDSSVEEDAEDSDCGNSSVEVKQFSNEGDEVDVAVGLSVSVHGEEADDLSPRSISMLEAEEGRDGKQGMEKLLLERLLVRKELRLTAMQEKVEMQGARLREAESRLALLETIPGFFFFQWLGLLLLTLMLVLKKACRVNYLLVGFCKLSRLLLLPFAIYFENPKNPKTGEAEEEKDSKSLVSVKENFSQANHCSPAIIGRVNPRNRGLGF